MFPHNGTSIHDCIKINEKNMSGVDMHMDSKGPAGPWTKRLLCKGSAAIRVMTAS